LAPARGASYALARLRLIPLSPCISRFQHLSHSRIKNICSQCYIDVYYSRVAFTTRKRFYWRHTKSLWARAFTVTRTLAPAITGSDFRVISESNAARVAGQTVWQCTHFSQRLCPGNKEIQLPIPCMYERSAGVSISCIFSLGIMSPMSICSCTGPASHACPPLPTHIKKTKRGLLEPEPPPWQAFTWQCRGKDGSMHPRVTSAPDKRNLTTHAPPGKSTRQQTTLPHLSLFYRSIPPTTPRHHSTLAHPPVYKSLIANIYQLTNLQHLTSNY
jgi:hypothetical protein